METKFVVLIGVGAFILGGITGVFAMRDACRKAEEAVDQLTEKVLGITTGKPAEAKKK